MFFMGQSLFDRLVNAVTTLRFGPASISIHHSFLLLSRLGARRGCSGHLCFAVSGSPELISTSLAIWGLFWRAVNKKETFGRLEWVLVPALVVTLLPFLQQGLALPGSVSHASAGRWVRPGTHHLRSLSSHDRSFLHGRLARST